MMKLITFLFLSLIMNISMGQQCKEAFAQCGGGGYTGSTCCQNGYVCIALSEWWSQCNPPPCSNQWEQCGGTLWSGPTCCKTPYRCNYQSEWYSQCLI
mmetsp:Transcript_18175/g.16245  ORF Transcript_18175/g.16245 Transcript_18175/m.16245 type:complete len:98 (-) Transcript_18175:13-306(-)